MTAIGGETKTTVDLVETLLHLRARLERLPDRLRDRVLAALLGG